MSCGVRRLVEADQLATSAHSPAVFVLFVAIVVSRLARGHERNANTVQLIFLLVLRLLRPGPCDSVVKLVFFLSNTIHRWPEQQHELMELHDYYAERAPLSVIDASLLMYNGRLVIPERLRAQMLQIIHDDGHMSLTKSRERARTAVWWPRRGVDLKT